MGPDMNLKEWDHPAQLLNSLQVRLKDLEVHLPTAECYGVTAFHDRRESFTISTSVVEKRTSWAKRGAPIVALWNVSFVAFHQDGNPLESPTPPCRVCFQMKNHTTCRDPCWHFSTLDS